jgi:hypothetical protein
MILLSWRTIILLSYGQQWVSRSRAGGACFEGFPRMPPFGMVSQSSTTLVYRQMHIGSDPMRFQSAPVL